MNDREQTRPAPVAPAGRNGSESARRRPTAAAIPADTAAPVDRDASKTYDGDPVTIAHAEIATALKDGTARALSRFITDFVTYADRWWLLTNDGWLRIDDPGLLDAISQSQRWSDESES